MQEHLCTALVTLAALVLFIGAGTAVGVGRHRYGIKAPAMTGHDVFERLVRAQMNTLEQIVVFLPALWLSAIYWSETISMWIGAAWVVVRLAYIVLYVRAPERRGLAFTVGSLLNAALVIGAAVGVIGRLV